MALTPFWKFRAYSFKLSHSLKTKYIVPKMARTGPTDTEVSQCEHLEHNFTFPHHTYSQILKMTLIRLKKWLILK